jgi:hypothetical protein
MNPKSAQQKGKRLENYVCEALEEMGLGKAVRTPGSGSGKIKGDTFSAIDFTIECKNQKQFHWQDIDQAKEEAQKGNYYKDKWVLVMRDPRKPEFEAVYAVMDLGQFLELLKKNKEPIVKEPDRQTNWDIKNLIQSAKRVIKDFEI